MPTNQIDQLIPLQIAPVKINTPFENLKIVMDGKAAEQQVRDNEFKLREQAQTADDQEAARRILREANGDWEVALPRIRQVSPTAALEIESKIGKLRAERAQALKHENDVELANTQKGLALGRAALQDPESWSFVRQRMAALIPDLASMLPEQFDPAFIRQIQTFGEDAAGALERREKALQYLAEGKFYDAAAQALSTANDAEEWEGTKGMLHEHGVPSSVLGIFGDWGPDARDRALELGMSPDTRADNARLDAGLVLDREKFGEQKRVHRVTEAQTNRRIGIDATRERRMGETGGSGERLPTPTSQLNATISLRTKFVTETKAAAESARAVANMQSSLSAVRQGAEAPGSQGVLVTFQKILDPESVVRESEYARSASGLSLMSQLQGMYERIARGGAGVPLGDLEQYVQLADEWNRNAQASARQVKSQYDGIAQKYGLDPGHITREYTPDTPAQAAPAGGGASRSGATPPVRRYKFNLKTGKMEQVR